MAEWSVSGLDADREVRRFHQLWLAADDDGLDGTVPAGVRNDFVPSQRPAPVPAGPAPAPGATLTNVPAPARHFTGRERLLAEIRAVLSGSNRMPLSLVGLGGVGKTQLALQYVARWAAEYDVLWWVPAEQPSQAIAALAALGDQLGISLSNDMRQIVRDVLAALEESALRWLLIYDNADQPEDLSTLLPAAGGQVLVTSRNYAWASAAGTPFSVGVFSRDESIAFMREWGVTAPADDCDTLAEQLGDLPLAVDQVCAMQTATGMPLADYLRLFAEHLDELLAAGLRPGSRTTTVATFVNVAAGRLRAESVAASQLLELLAFMAPSPVPIYLLHAGRGAEVTLPLGRSLYSSEELTRLALQLGRYGLAQVSSDGQQLQMHRLVQVMVRERLSEQEAYVRRLDVHRLLVEVNPKNPDDSRTWPQHSEIGPHLVTSDALRSPEMPAREAVLDQIRYLERIGDFEASAKLCRLAVDAWRADSELGPEHRLTTRATRHLANALRSLGSYNLSRNMIVDLLKVLRTSDAYGPDHPDTLQTANVLAFYLRLAGEYQKAFEEDRRRVEALRRLHGPEDVRTTEATGNLAVNLRLLGKPAAALEYDAALVSTLSRAVGAENERTLVAMRNQMWDLLGLGRFSDAVRSQPEHRGRRAASEIALVQQALAVALRKLGRVDAALRTAAANYRTCQSLNGPDHHLTLASIMTYANTLRAVGDAMGARRLATEALDRYRRLFGAENPLTLAASTNLAVALRALGQWREAYNIDELTYEQTSRILGPDHPHTLATAIGLANDLAHHHLQKDAVALGSATLKRLRQVRGDDHPETWACAANLALDQNSSRREPVERLTALLGPDHPEVAAALAGMRLECDIEPPPT
ncbi:FxSxx-COOH system tetratricopeptide repeat protein [Paractinoplanes ferrugineus]|uniref:FxSxx-COOH system tetratricopeptide repeat protein n=1 Tax=Paractinoplanes ferrugineus TaxID=113564 RepID=UPI0019454988|nr:FxSxx-COOH system tetratricopeptide repeat protein [Actinoplanes ferrugineus]